MKKRIAILANHSGGLYDFRKDLIAELKIRECYGCCPT